MRYRPIRNRWPQRMAQRTRAEKNPYKYLGRLWRLEFVWQQHECIRLAFPCHSTPLPLLPALLSRRERINHPNEKGLGLAGVETSHPITAAWLSQLHPGTALRYPPEQHQLLHLHGSCKAAKTRANPPAFVLSTHTAGQSVSAFPPREPVNVPGSPDGPPLAPAVISPRPTANHDSASIPRCHSAPLVLLCLIRGNLLRLPPRPTRSPRGFAGVCVARPA